MAGPIKHRTNLIIRMMLVVLLTLPTLGLVWVGGGRPAFSTQNA